MVPDPTIQDTVRAGLRFTGQSTMDAWSIRDLLRELGWSRYDQWLSQETILSFQRIKDLVEQFPTWQHRAATGRPPTDDRVVLVALILRQYLHASFRRTESTLQLLTGFFGFDQVPDANTLSEKNRSGRCSTLLRRFKEFLLSLLPKRRPTIVTDATGYSNQKATWRETDYGLRATQDWLKTHAAVEVPQLFFLNTVITKGRVHDSQKFGAVWDGFPSNVRPRRSLADSAYGGNECLAVARAAGATPFHAIKSNARVVRDPKTDYQKRASFAVHWPNRNRQLTAKRGAIETAFYCVKERFGHRLRCRDPVARRNEILTKHLAHNIWVLTMRSFLVSG